MNDEIKKDQNREKKKNFNFRIGFPVSKTKGKEAASDASAEKREEVLEKRRKVPKRSGLIVASGKSRKKLVNGSLKKTEHTSEEALKLAEKKASGKKQKKDSGIRRERDLTTSSHTARRIDRERQKLRKARLEARKAELLKTRLLMGAAAAVILGLVILLAACPGKKQKTEERAAVSSESASTDSEGMVSASEVRHFSFPMLISDDMAGDSSVLTISQFRQILQQLYDANYILVDFYSIAETRQSEEGEVSFIAADLAIPDGKIPFVLSQRDVSYSLDRIGKGYASRMIITEDGQLTNQYQNVDGTVLQGSYDVVPVLEEFIAEHPDFSYENARGVLGLTGYNGILGYRTSELLGKSAEEGNSYAVYGVFDVNAEIEAVKPVIDTLKQKGWHFACYGYNYCSYGAEYDMMISDMELWQNSVSGLVDGTDLLMFPCQTDIGSWSEYRADNQKYQYLKGLGFSYFCIEENVNPSWLQIRSDYVRQGMKEIDSYEDFTKIMGE